MSRIVEILKPVNTVDGLFASFTVDNTVDSVDIILPPTPVFKGLSNYDGQGFFVNGDNIELLSFGLPLPVGYDLAVGSSTGAIKVDVYYIEDSVAKFEKFLRTWMPFGNYEYAIDSFFSHRSIPDSNNSYSLVWDILEPIKISMVGIPDSENGKVYKVAPFVKVAHSLEMFGG